MVIGSLLDEHLLVNYIVYMSTRKFTHPPTANDKRTLSVHGLPGGLDFREAMDGAMVKIGLEDIAKAAGCSVNTLKQSRLSPDTVGYRSPPAGLRQALHELCKDRAKYFMELAERLRAPKTR